MRKNNLQKEYIIKFKDSMAYLKGLGGKKYKYTFNIEEAKRYTKTDAENIGRSKELEIVNYNQEKYNYKEKQYQLYIKVLLDEKEDINRDDLISFCKEYEGESDLRGKFTAYISLKEKYPNNRLVDEIARLGKIIDYKDNVICYETRLNLSKDKNFLKDNNPIIISAEETDKYEKRKTYLDMVKQKYPFDYDVAKQYDILDNEFKHKYITQDIYKEFYEKQYEEEYEIPST